MSSAVQRRHSSESENSEATEELFIQLLLSLYGKMCNTIRPIPYIKGKHYDLGKLFTESVLLVRTDHDTKSNHTNWERLSSNNILSSNEFCRSRRCVIVGGPGYGKTTIISKLVSDWRNGAVDSPMRQVKILILLRLRQIGRVESIFRAIKFFLLSRDPRFANCDIQRILENCPSVLFFFEGYDEYHGRKGRHDSDVNRIMEGKMFGNASVILTSRHNPTSFSDLPKCVVRLDGFDETARNEYIRKVVALDHASLGVSRINRILIENPVLDAICEIPLFFCLYVHIAEGRSMKFNSVTSIFRHMIQCFHSHLRNKTEDENVRKFSRKFEVDVMELGKIALETLNAERQNCGHLMTSENLISRMSEEGYEYYTALGLFVNEDVFDISNNDAKNTVRFYHKLFLEWYAAHGVINAVMNYPSVKLENILDKIDVNDNQYLYCFVCGLNQSLAYKVISYLNGRQGCRMIAVLCVLERTGSIDGLDPLRHLCSERVEIDGSDSKLLQRAKVKLLDIASKNKVPIKCVMLRDSFQKVNESGDNIYLKSGMYLPIVSSPTTIAIEDQYGRELTPAEFVALITYASRAKARNLEFFKCILPPSLATGAEVTLMQQSDFPKMTWGPFSDVHLEHTGSAKKEIYTWDYTLRSWKIGSSSRGIEDAEYQDLIGRMKGLQSAKPTRGSSLEGTSDESHSKGQLTNGADIPTAKE